MKTKADETSNLSHMQIQIIGIAQKQKEEHNRKMTLTGFSCGSMNKIVSREQKLDDPRGKKPAGTCYTNSFFL